MVLRILQFIATAAICILTVILPLKFGSLTGIPEASGLFPEDFYSWLIISWPVSLFPLFSGVVLLLALLAFRPRPERQKHAFITAGLWLLLGLAGYAGAVNAGTRDFVYLQIPHGLGIGAYAASVYLLLANRPEFRRKFLMIIIGTGILLGVLGWEQRYISFEDTRKFALKQAQETGIPIPEAMRARIWDNRIYTTFSAANNLAGYFLMTMPLLFWLAWQMGSRVDPPAGGRAIFLLLAGFLMVIPFFMTGSRAGIAAALATAGLFVLAFPVNRYLRFSALGGLIFMVIAGAVLVMFSSRGFWSMFARADYQWQSLKIFAANPIFGTGWGDFFHDYMLIKLYPSNEAPHDPHCMIAGYFSQCGLIGGLSCLAALFYPLVEGWRKIRRSAESFYRNIDTWIFLAVAAGVIHSQVETNMQVPALMCLLAALQIILLTEEKPTQEKRLVNQPLWVILFVFAAAWHGAVGSWSSWKLVKGEKAFAALYDLATPQGKTPEQFAKTTPIQVNDALVQVTELRPYSPFPWQIAGDYMFGRKLYPQAEEYYRKALELSANRASVWHRLHRIYRMTGNEEKAAEYLQRSRELFPINEDYHQPWSPPYE